MTFLNFSPKLLECFKHVTHRFEELARDYADGLSPKMETFDTTLPAPKEEYDENSQAYQDYLTAKDAYDKAYEQYLKDKEENDKAKEEHENVKSILRLFMILRI